MPAVSSFERIEAIIGSDEIYLLAELLPKAENGESGRPRNFPDYTVFLFEALISVYGSARKAETELSDRTVWHFIRREIKKRFKNQDEMHLPAQRYKRHHYEYMRNRYLTNPIILEQIREKHREIAAQQAKELGLIDPQGHGSLTHPSLDRLLYADGKVIAPLYKAAPGTTRIDRETGEVKAVRFEADADLHFQGDGEMAYGVKFLMTAVRSSEVHGRIILDADHVADKGGEANTALKSFKAIAPHGPGIQGVIYDTALRGKHHNEIMQQLGWLSINRIQAEQIVKREGKPVKRVEKATHIEDRVVNGKTLRLFARNGGLCIAELDHNGDQILTETPRIKTLRRQDKTGKFKFYNEYELPTQETVLVRLDTTEEDKARKLNRSENLRQIPVSDPDFKRIYIRRSDAESINRALDDTMWLGRAHSKGAKRQLMNLIGYAITVNSLALHLHKKKQAPAPPNDSKAAA